MKAITILEPWASLIACGDKKIETRSWVTRYRGQIAIHAGKSKKFTRGVMEDYFTFKYGKVIAIADLIDCVKMIGSKLSPEGIQLNSILENGKVVDGNELAFGDYTPGRYAWILENVRRIEPVPAKGQQGLWNFNFEGEKENVM